MAQLQQNSPSIVSFQVNAKELHNICRSDAIVHPRTALGQLPTAPDNQAYGGGNAWLNRRLLRLCLRFWTGESEEQPMNTARNFRSGNATRHKPEETMPK